MPRVHFDRCAPATARSIGASTYATLGCLAKKKECSRVDVEQVPMVVMPLVVMRDSRGEIEELQTV